MIVKPKKKFICWNCKLEINKNNLETPDKIVENGYNIYNIWCDFDLCAWENTTKFDHYFNEIEDALKQDFPTSRGTLWCNPPHNKTKQFVIKCAEQNKKLGVGILMLIPINCMTSNYFKKYALPLIVFDKRMLISRINFLCPHCHTPTKENSVNGYVYVYFKGVKE